MAVIATESTHFSNVVKGIYKDNGLNFNFETVIVNDPAGTLVIGQILGKVTVVSTSVQLKLQWTALRLLMQSWLKSRLLLVLPTLKFW